MSEIRYPYTQAGLQEKQKACDDRKWGIKIEGLDQAFDLAQVIKHLMIDRKRTSYTGEGTGDKRAQCDSSRARTVEDLTVVANTYGINISFANAVKAVEALYSARLLTHSYCGTVRREVHSPQRITITADEIRNAIGKLNVKNPDYVKPKRKSTTASTKNK